MGSPALLAPPRRPAPSAPASTPFVIRTAQRGEAAAQPVAPATGPGGGPAAADDGPGFLARYWFELASRPARLIAALMATAVAPVVVIEAGAVARATAELAGRPHTPRPVVPVAAGDLVPKRAPVVPLAGDLQTWRAAAWTAAATCPGLPSEVLVAIAKVETGLGIRTDASYAGAVGPMQFLPATWSAYGVDGDGDGRIDVMNPVDALHGAARLLCANGGGDPHRLRTAVWHYNRSVSYVERVATLAGLTAWSTVE